MFRYLVSYTDMKGIFHVVPTIDGAKVDVIPTYQDIKPWKETTVITVDNLTLTEAEALTLRDKLNKALEKPKGWHTNGYEAVSGSVHDECKLFYNDKIYLILPCKLPAASQCCGSNSTPKNVRRLCNFLNEYGFKPTD